MNKLPLICAAIFLLMIQTIVFADDPDYVDESSDIQLSDIPHTLEPPIQPLREIQWPVDWWEPIYLTSHPSLYDVSTYDKYIKSYNNFLAKIKKMSSGSKVCIPVHNGKPIRAPITGSIKSISTSPKGCVVYIVEKAKCNECSESYRIAFTNLGNDMCSGSFTSNMPVENGVYRPYPGDVGCDIAADPGSPVKPIGSSGVKTFKIRYAECTQCKNSIPVSGYHSRRWDCENIKTGRGDCAISIQPIDTKGNSVGSYISYLHLSNIGNVKKNDIVDGNTVLGYSGTANRLPHLHVQFGDTENPFTACNRIKEYIGSQKKIAKDSELRTGDVIGWAGPSQLFCFEIKKPAACSAANNNAFDMLPKIPPLTKQEYEERKQNHLLH